MEKNAHGRIRFCKIMECEKLKGNDCTVKECVYPNTDDALRIRRNEIEEAKYGRRS